MEQILWEIKKQIKEPTLTQNLKTDILIVGGGITGISCAFELSKTHQNITVVDQNKCGHGVTLRTTGKLTFLQGDQYSKIENCYGIEKAKLYLRSQQEAIQIAKENIEKYRIDCDFQEVDSYIFVFDQTNLEKLEKEQNILKQLCKIKKTKLPLDFPCAKSLSVSSTAIFHPLKYLLKLKELCKEKQVSFFEDTMVTKIERQQDHYLIVANQHTIEAQIVILCCHYPTFLKPGWIPFKTYLEKSYIGAIPNMENKHLSAINLDPDTYSFRYHSSGKENYLLYLSETHKLSDDVDYQKRFDRLTQKIRKDIKQKPKYLWSNYDLMTNDFLPLIGKTNKNQPHLYLATGFNTWGMTNGILSGKIIADLINQKKNPYTDLFRPDRPLNLTKLTNDAINDINTAKIFMTTKIKKDYPFYPNNVKIVVKNGKRYGIYTDPKGQDHTVSLLCPHMKCSVIFNPVDQTWDCPCHGSRFDIDGNVLKGPACYSIKVDLD